MSATRDKIDEVVAACRRHSERSIVVLSGVAGTGKTHIARTAALELAGHAAFIREVQFHQSYTYEEFVEGLRPTDVGRFEPREGVFLEWNRQAQADPTNTYVLLIEELSRAPITAVLGELMTYVEHRSRQFLLPVSRKPATVADNLVVLATMNPRDRSALEVDDALIRRLRIIECRPDTAQLAEMLEQSLADNGSESEKRAIVESLTRLFVECEAQHPDTYHVEMPFGHGMFAGVSDTDDLEELWHQRIKHILRRPLVLPHPFTETIEALYPTGSGGGDGDSEGSSSSSEEDGDEPAS